MGYTLKKRKFIRFRRVFLSTCAVLGVFLLPEICAKASDIESAINASLGGAAMREVEEQLEVPKNIDVTYTADLFEGDAKRSRKELTRVVCDLISGKTRLESLTQVDKDSALYRVRTWNGKREQSLEAVVPARGMTEFPQVFLGPSNGYINTRPFSPNSALLSIFTLGDKKREIIEALPGGKIDEKLGLFRIYVKPNQNLAFDPKDGGLRKVWTTIYNSEKRRAETLRSIDIKSTFVVDAHRVPETIDAFESGVNWTEDIKSSIGVDKSKCFINKHLDDNLFEVTFPVGCLVQNNIDGTKSRVDGSGAVDFSEENIVNHLDNLLRQDPP